jgi:hypothetical protein
MADTPNVVITLDDLKVVDRVNKFIRRTGDTIVVESTMELSQLAWLVANGRVLLSEGGVGFTWVPKAK